LKSISQTKDAIRLICFSHKNTF